MKNLTTNEKYSIFHGLAMNISLNMMNGYIPLFALAVLGASNQQIGLINSLPSIIGLLALLPSAMWLNRVKSLRNFTAVTTIATRFIFVLIFFSPFFPGHYASWILVLLFGLLNFPGALTNLSWQAMIGDMIPEKRRSSFFSTRNAFINIAVLLTTLGTGLFLQKFGKHNAFPYQVLLLAAFVFGIIEVYFLLKHKETKSNRELNALSQSKPPFLKLFKYKPYTYFVICALIFNFAWQMAWALFSIYSIREAHATALWISLFAVANQIAQIFSVKIWAKFADRYGNTFMLFIASMGMATAPILNILSTNLKYLFFINMFSGIFVAGTVLLLFNQLLHVSPQANRTSSLANYNLLVSIVGFIAPQAGVYMLNVLGMHSAMSIISILRFLAGVPFLVVALKFEKKRVVSSS